MHFSPKMLHPSMKRMINEPRGESNYSANHLQPHKQEERYNMKYDIRCKNVCCKTKHNYSANQLQPQKRETRQK